LPALVLDASTALAWMLLGEVDAARAGHLIQMVAAEGAIAPSHWARSQQFCHQPPFQVEADSCGLDVLPMSGGAAAAGGRPATGPA
jgi:hypothetical protein